MTWTRSFRALVVALFLVCAAASAWAQQVTTYGIQTFTVGSKYESIPAGATQLTSIASDDSAQAVTLPFTFPYFGSNYTTAYVTSNGIVSFTGSYPTYYTNTAFPATNYPMLYVYWDDLNASNVPVRTWVTGTAPNRHFTISWDGIPTLSYGGSLYIQVQLYETTGSIVYSYGSAGNWSTNSGQNYMVGIMGPTGQWEIPTGIQNSSTANAGRPPYDYSFDNFRVTFTGRALYDRYVVDASGIGGTIEQNLPLAGLNVEARNAAGATVGIATTDAQGAFSLAAVGVPPTEVGSIVVTSGSPACNVRATATGPLSAATLATNVSFAADLNVGTLTLTESNDPGGNQRAPINIVRSMAQVYNWAKARTTESILTVDPVIYSPASTASSSYTPKNGSTPASMVVSSPAGNNDAWDASILRKMYGRHVLASVAGDAGTTFDDTFDKATDDYNAFAEGFGHYMNVIASGDVKFFDAKTSGPTTTIDYETPTMTTTPASNVAGWIAAALFDLTDPANESWDTFNGAGTAGEQVFSSVVSMSTAVTSTTFFNAWVTTQGYDGTGLARNFIHYNLISDDPDEPNDFASEAKQITQFGFIRTNRVLNRFNEDHYRFTMPDPTDSLTASIIYDRNRYPSVSVTVELTNLAGSVIATGSPQGVVGPIVATSGALSSGEYRLRVALAGGGPLPDYTVQVFSALAFKSDEFQPWTLNRPINVPVNVKGGIPPYNLTVLAPFEKPDGLILDGVNGRVAGSPTGPQFPNPPIAEGGSYTYSFILSAQDAATPPNTASGTVAFKVNDIVRNHAEEFIAFPWNKSVNRDCPFTGGTAPYQFSIDQGALPTGLSIATVPRLHFTGTPDTPGSGIMTLTDEDVAASSATCATTCVVCVPINQTTNLALGASACGFYFDALEGTSVSLAMTTPRGQPVRVLRTQILDADGFTVVPSRTKVGKGKASVTGFIAPHTGRFYCIVASDVGDSSKIACKGKVVLAKSIAGNNGTRDIKPNDSPFVLNVGALAGTQMTLTVKPDKSGLQLSSTYIIDPSGNYLTYPEGQIKPAKKDGGFSFTRTLDATGTWKVLVVAKPGPQGRFTYSLKLKQPKGVYVEN